MSRINEIRERVSKAKSEITAKQAGETTYHYANDIAYLLAKIERLKAERRWIPVAERMPCISDGNAISNTIHVVLCHFADGNTDVFDIDDIDIWNDFNSKSKYKITHWMPLPEPPKEEGKNE